MTEEEVAAAVGLPPSNYRTWRGPAGESWGGKARGMPVDEPQQVGGIEDGRPYRRATWLGDDSCIEVLFDPKGRAAGTRFYHQAPFREDYLRTTWGTLRV